jgi:hypothetical protein
MDLATFIPTVALVLALPVVFAYLSSLTIGRKWLVLLLLAAGIPVLTALLMWLSRVLQRWWKRRCLLEGRLACWPFARPEDIVAGQPGNEGDEP